MSADSWSYLIYNVLNHINVTISIQKILKVFSTYQSPTSVLVSSSWLPTRPWPKKKQTLLQAEVGLDSRDKMASAESQISTEVCENGMEETLRMCLALTKEEANPDQYRVIVETLLKIFQNTARDPQAEKFRRLRTANATFRHRVWRFDGAQQFMLAAGWIQVDEGVVLPNDVQLTVALQLLEGEHRLEGQTFAGHTSQLTPEEVKKQAIINEERRKREAALRREKEERKRIRDQIKADRKDTSTRESKDSHATHLTGSSGGMTKFEDIGVNLSQGGG